MVWYRGSHWLCEGETFQDGDSADALWRNSSSVFLKESTRHFFTSRSRFWTSPKCRYTDYKATSWKWRNTTMTTESVQTYLAHVDLESSYWENQLNPAIGSASFASTTYVHTLNGGLHFNNSVTIHGLSTDNKAFVAIELLWSLHPTLSVLYMNECFEISGGKLMTGRIKLKEDVY